MDGCWVEASMAPPPRSGGGWEGASIAFLSQASSRNLGMARNEVQHEQARHLRRNATEAEKRLWEEVRLRKLGVKFRRQHPIGSYIVDFACPALKLVVEIDGPQHDLQRDRIRDAELRHRGWTVIRVLNQTVLRDMPYVLRSLRRALPSATSE